MLLYGVQVTNRIYNTDNIEKFIKRLMDTTCKDIVENYFIGEKDGCDDALAWVDTYRSRGHDGLAAFLTDVINKLENINITCGENNGASFIGIIPDLPWNFNRKIKTLNKEEYSKIFEKYFLYLTDDSPEVRWWKIQDDGILPEGICPICGDNLFTEHSDGTSSFFCYNCHHYY